MKTIYAGISLAISLLFSCQQKAGDFRTVSAEEFASFIASPEVQRVDVRTLAEYSEGHIPGSLNINVLDKQFEAVADSLLQKDRPVALYCRSGKRSKKAARLLSDKGYKVYELDKGFQAWQQKNFNIEK